MGRARDIANLIGGATPDIILKTSDGAILNLQTSDTTVTQDSVLGAINFQAPDEADGTDAILVASKIEAIAEGTFSASSNATSLVFTTASSAAAGTASGKMTFTSGGELVIKDTDTADGSSPTITLQSGDTDIAQDDVLGTINFQAPDEGTGTDAILVASTIKAFSEGDFSSSNNATTLELSTGRSAAAGSDGGRMRLTSAGVLELKNQNTADDSFPTITLQTGDTDIAQDDVLGRILFQAPDEGAGTDAITSSARIQAFSTGDFSSSSNATGLELRVASSAVVGTAGDGSSLTLLPDNQLNFKSMSTADGSFPQFELQTGETAVEQNDILGAISFKAPDESGGTDAITQAAFIIARAGADFTSSVNNTNLQFGTGLSGSASTRMTVGSNGNVTIEDGDLVIGTSGHGIDFSATGNVTGTGGETLDDFEEGSFDVVLETATGTATINSSFNTLSYTKIGHLVVVTGGIRVGSVSSPDGSFTINSVPFTPKSTSEDTHHAQISVLHDTLTGISGATACVGQIVPGNAKMFIFTQEASGVADMGNHLQSGSIIRIQCAYLTAS